MTKIFVYGTLLIGEANHRLLANAEYRGAARTAGEYRLVNLGPYPAMVEGDAGEVVGEVYEVDDDTLALLDRLEGVPGYYYRREIELIGGVTAIAYFLDEARTSGAPVITSGDWRSVS